ncbi:MAG: alpha-2-macroglobulin family protein, partial [Candidatus Kariarchaeaceae archaeon]
EFILADLCQKGAYELRIEVDSDNDQAPSTFSIPINVYSIEQPQIIVELAVPSALKKGEELEVQISAKYFYGDPVKESTGVLNLISSNLNLVKTWNVTLDETGSFVGLFDISDIATDNFTLRTEITDKKGERGYSIKRIRHVDNLITASLSCPDLITPQMKELMIEGSIRKITGQPERQLPFLLMLVDPSGKTFPLLQSGKTSNSGNFTTKIPLSEYLLAEETKSLFLLLESEKGSTNESIFLSKRISVQHSETISDKNLQIQLLQDPSQVSSGTEIPIQVSASSDLEGLAVFVNLALNKQTYSTHGVFENGKAQLNLVVPKSAWGIGTIEAYSISKTRMVFKDYYSIQIEPKANKINVSIYWEGKYKPGDKATVEIISEDLQGVRTPVLLSYFLQDSLMLDEVYRPNFDELFFNQEVPKIQPIIEYSWMRSRFYHILTPFFRQIIGSLYETKDPSLLAITYELIDRLFTRSIISESEFLKHYNRIMEYVTSVLCEEKASHDQIYAVLLNLFEIQSLYNNNKKIIVKRLANITAYLIPITNQFTRKVNELVSPILALKKPQDEHETICNSLFWSNLAEASIKRINQLKAENEPSNSIKKKIFISLKKQLEELQKTVIDEEIDLSSSQKGQLSEAIDALTNQLNQLDVKVTDFSRYIQKIPVGKDQIRTRPQKFEIPQNTSFLAFQEVMQKQLKADSSTSFPSLEISSVPSIERLGEEEDNEFKDTQSVRTSQWVSMRKSTGETKITFPLPNNKSSQKLRVLALTNEPTIGYSESTISPEITLTITIDSPKVITMNDEFEVGIILANLEDNDLAGKLTFSSSLVTSINPSEEILIPAKSSIRVNHIISPTRIGNGFINCVFKGETLITQQMDPLRVIPCGSPLIESRRAYVEERSTHQDISIDYSVESADKCLSNLTLLTGEKALAVDAYEKILDYPYLTVEKNAFVILVGAKIIKFFTPKEGSVPKRFSHYKTQIKASIQRLASFQNSDGAWGWFKAGSSDLTITSLVVKALGQLASIDIFVDTSLIDDGVNWLLQKRNEKGYWEYSGEPSPIRSSLSLTSYIFNSLMSLDIDLPPSLVDDVHFYLKENMSSMRDDPFISAMLLLTFKYSDEKRYSQVLSRHEQIIRRTRETSEDEMAIHWPGGSAIGGAEQTTALCLKILHHQRRRYSVIRKGLEWLIFRRTRKGVWRNLQSTAEVIDVLLNVTEEPIFTEGSIAISLNDQPLREYSISQDNIIDLIPLIRNIPLHSQEGVNKTQIYRVGEIPLYYDLILERWDETYHLTSSLLKLNRSINELHLVKGDELTIKLSINPTQEFYQVVIEEPIASGFTVDKPSLEHLVETGVVTEYHLMAETIVFRLNTLPNEPTELVYKVTARGVGKFWQNPASIFPLHQPHLMAQSEHSSYSISKEKPKEEES